MADLIHQLATAKIEAVADFRKSEFFEENMLLQGPVMQMGQTKVNDVCSEVCCPQLNKEDPRLVELYNPNAEVDFESQFQKFVEGADLRENEE